MINLQALEELEFEVRAHVTGRQFLADKALRAKSMHNKDADAILRSSVLSCKHANKKLFPCWVNPVVAYPKSGDRLTETIIFDGITYKVPEMILERHIGKTNLLLVLERGFDMDSDFVISGKVAKVLALPEGNGWRIPDKETGIPQGSVVLRHDPEARYGLFRNQSAYIGPIIRGWVIGESYKRVVFAGMRIDEDLAVGLAGTYADAFRELLRRASGLSENAGPKELEEVRAIVRRLETK